MSRPLPRFIDVFGLQTCFLRTVLGTDLTKLYCIPVDTVGGLKRVLSRQPDDIELCVGLVTLVSPDGEACYVTGSSLGDGWYSTVYLDPNLDAKLSWLRGEPVEVLHNGEFIGLEVPAYADFPRDSALCPDIRYRPGRERNSPSSRSPGTLADIPPGGFADWDDMVRSVRDVLSRCRDFISSMPDGEFRRVAFVATLARDGRQVAGFLAGSPSRVGESFVDLVGRSAVDLCMGEGGR